MGFSSTLLPQNSTSDRHIAWCLRQVLNGTLSEKASYQALTVRAATLGEPLMWAGDFAALIRESRRDGVPPQYLRAAGDWDAADEMDAGVREIVAAGYRRLRPDIGVRDAEWHAALNEPIEVALKRRAA